MKFKDVICLHAFIVILPYNATAPVHISDAWYSNLLRYRPGLRVRHVPWVVMGTVYVDSHIIAFPHFLEPCDMPRRHGSCQSLGCRPRRLRQWLSRWGVLWHGRRACSMMMDRLWSKRTTTAFFLLHHEICKSVITDQIKWPQVAEPRHCRLDVSCGLAFFHW